MSVQASLSNTIRSLEKRRSALAVEMHRIDRQLDAISRAMRAAHAAKAGPVVASRPAGKSAKPSKRKARRTWFERNEVTGLLKKAARQPIRQADLVRELAKVKGYDRTLGKDEARLFEGAAFMAIANALDAKVLKRGADGSVMAVAARN